MDCTHKEAVHLGENVTTYNVTTVLLVDWNG